MRATEFLGLAPSDQPKRWSMPITSGIATRGDFLFGGCGLGAAVAALEGESDRPVIWATAQYLSFAMTGETMDLDVIIAVSGRMTTQARVVAHVGDREILTVNAALGEKPLPYDRNWVEMPEVPRPDDCPRRSQLVDDGKSVMSRFDMRLALGNPWDEMSGTPAPGARSALWVHTPEVEMSAAAIAILGDYVPFGISQAFGEWIPSNSLDNTIRVHRLEPTEWVLCDVRIDSVSRGFGHGSVYLWTESGTLLATASQSAVLHRPRD